MAKRPKHQSKQCRWDKAIAGLQSMLDEAQGSVSDLDGLRQRAEKHEIKWDAVDEQLDVAREQIALLTDDGATHVEEIRSLHEELESWRDNLPEGLDQSPTAEKLDAILDEDFPQQLDDAIETIVGETLTRGRYEIGNMEDCLDELHRVIDETEGAEMPLGFGRD